jgi:mono/diheme cytochrome c family protein
MLVTEGWGEFEPYQQTTHVAVVGLLLLGLAPASVRAEPDDTVAEVSASDPRSLEYPTWQTLRTGEYAAYNQRGSLIQRGKHVYERNCLGCHGVDGDGNGPAAKRLITKPRDFTTGIYKFRTTDSGSLPMEGDLHRTITQGLARVSMPAFPLMTERDKLSVIEYIKNFYPDWERKKVQREVVPVPLAPNNLDREQRIKRGRVVYANMQCWKCHGTDGAGKGATQTEYVDAWDQPQKPLDFTRGRLKGGDTPRDIYRTFHTGLRSIMPAYGGETLAAVTQESVADLMSSLDAEWFGGLESTIASFPETNAALYSDMDTSARHKLVVRNSWDLVAYVMALRKNTLTTRAVLGVGDEE